MLHLRTVPLSSLLVLSNLLMAEGLSPSVGIAGLEDCERSPGTPWRLVFHELDNP